MPLYISSSPFIDGVLTFPASAWGFISSFISCSNNSPRSPGWVVGLLCTLERALGTPAGMGHLLTPMSGCPQAGVPPGPRPAASHFP